MSMKALTWAQAQTVGSPTKKLVLLILADRASDDDWSTFAGQETIAAATELNIRSVRRALSELEDDGMIERSQRRRPDGYRTSDLIRVNMQWEPSDSPPDPVDNSTSPDRESGDRESGDTVSASSDLHSEPHRTQSQVTLCPTSPDTLSDLTGHSDRAENEPSVEPSVEPSENDARAAPPRTNALAIIPTNGNAPPARVTTLPTAQPIPTGQYPSDFEAWYAAYPRKRAKADAARSWKRARSTATWEQLIGGLERATAAWQRENTPPDKIPYPASWLNGRRWEDEADTQLARSSPAIYDGLERVLNKRAERRSS